MTKKPLIKERTKDFFRALAVFAVCIMLIVFPKGSSDGAFLGLKYCIELLVPSLFPFMVLSSYIVGSGLSSKLGRALSPFSRTVFGLPGCCAPTVILSFIGGFPVGARGVESLLENNEISHNEAQRMMLFCIGSGPAFLITAVGVGLVGDYNIGLILFASQIISGVILGIVSRFFYREKSVKNFGVKKAASHSGAFIKACSDGGAAILNLSALVIIFQAFIGMLEQSGIMDFCAALLKKLAVANGYSDALLPSVLEVTGGCNKICSLALPIPFLSAVIAFGGLCVHFQIFGILKSLEIKKPLFYLFRILNAVLSGAVTYIFCLYYRPASDVFSNITKNAVAGSATHITGSAALIVLCAVFTLSFGVNKKRHALQK